MRGHRALSEVEEATAGRVGRRDGCAGRAQHVKQVAADLDEPRGIGHGIARNDLGRCGADGDPKVHAGECRAGANGSGAVLGEADIRQEANHGGRPHDEYVAIAAACLDADSESSYAYVLPLAIAGARDSAIGLEGAVLLAGLSAGDVAPGLQNTVGRAPVAAIGEIPAALGEGRARRHSECHRQSETKGQHELSHCGSPSCPAEPCVGLAVACARAITSRLTWGPPRTAFLACAGSCTAHVQSDVRVYANSFSFAQVPLTFRQRSPGHNIAADLYRNVSSSSSLLLLLRNLPGTPSR